MEFYVHVLFEVFGCFSSGFIYFVDDVDYYFEAVFGFGFFDEFFNGIEGVEDDALAGAGYVAEYAVFNGVVFAGVGGIVCDADFKTEFLGEFGQVFFEDVVSAAVAAAAITQY